jgi:hypothetical protein
VTFVECNNINVPVNNQVILTINTNKWWLKC